MKKKSIGSTVRFEHLNTTLEGIVINVSSVDDSLFVAVPAYSALFEVSMLDCVLVKSAINAPVIAAINSERAYQEIKWPNHKHTAAEYICIMRHCLNKAEAAWVTQKGEQEALNEIRQVVATGVAAMEQLGAPIRIS